MSATAPLEAVAEPAAAQHSAGLPSPAHRFESAASGTGDSTSGVPRTSSANEPQLTEIRGPWPPQLRSPAQLATAAPPSRPRSSPLGPTSGGSGGPPSGGQQLPSAFQQPRSRGGPSWRQLDDGSWYTPGGEVEWEQGEEATPAQAALSSAAAQALIGSPLVGAASYSPPLSPISTQLLQPGPPQRQLSGGGGGAPQGGPPPCGLQRQPSPPLQRGPQRAESLTHALPDFQRQPSPLSPTWAARRTPSASAPGSPAPLGRRSGGLSASLLQEPSLRPNLLPVLNASPDVSPSGGLPPPASPFPAPAPAAIRQSPDLGAGAAAGDAGPGTSGAGGGFRDVGGLPTELIEKRERARWYAESPRQASNS